MANIDVTVWEANYIREAVIHYHSVVIRRRIGDGHNPKVREFYDNTIDKSKVLKDKLIYLDEDELI